MDGRNPRGPRGYGPRPKAFSRVSCILRPVASLNPLTRELVFKLVFYGPGLGGKTTTLQYIHATTKPEHRGKMVSLATPTDRTLYFDFLPLRVPRVRGMSVRLQLFTVPGQVYYGATRKLVLSGADGVVFVADSQAGRMDANTESLEDLNANLAEHNKSLDQTPHTFHWNKRDLSDLVPLEELDRRYNVHGAASLGTCATRGDGVFEGLERITRLVLRQYESELPKGEQPGLGLSVGGAEVSIAEAIRGLAEAPLVSKITPFHGMAAVRPEDAKPSAESEAPPDGQRGSSRQLTASPPPRGRDAGPREPRKRPPIPRRGGTPFLPRRRTLHREPPRSPRFPCAQRPKGASRSMADHFCRCRRSRRRRARRTSRWPRCGPSWSATACARPRRSSARATRTARSSRAICCSLGFWRRPRCSPARATLRAILGSCRCSWGSTGSATSRSARRFERRG